MNPVDTPGIASNRRVVYHFRVKRIKSRLVEIALVGGALLVALVGGEVLLRVVNSNSQRSSQILIENMEFAYTESWNSLGFRDPEYTLHKTSGHLRLLLIGDSFVEGAGVAEEHRIGRVVEEISRADESRPRVQVYSAGKPGVGTPEYVRIAHQMAVYSPDAVVLSFFIDNDVGEAKRDSGEDTGTKPWRELEGLARRAASQLVQKFVQHCGLPRSLFKFIDQVKDPTYRDNFCKQRVNPRILPRAAFGAVLGGENAYLRSLAERFESTPWTKEDLLEVRNTFPNRPFVVLLIPSYHQVSANYFPELRKVGYVYESGTQPVNDSLQRALRKFLESNGIDYIDLLEPLRLAEAKTSKRSYHAIDGHFNPAGARVAAEAISSWLKRPESQRNIAKEPISHDQ